MFRLLMLVVILNCSSLQAQAGGLLVPAYFDPETDQTDWNRLIYAAPQVSLMVIMNPNSGPGSSMDIFYRNNVRALQSAGGKVLGYVHTSNGRRPLVQVEREIAKYMAWYEVDGIFVDEMASNATPGTLGYYTKLAKFVRNYGSTKRIMANPGTSFSLKFITQNTADIFVDDEDVMANVMSTPQASWVVRWPATRFAEISIASHSDGEQAMWLLSHHHVGWVYATTLKLNPDPYASLPADFEMEVASVSVY